MEQNKKQRPVALAFCQDKDKGKIVQSAISNTFEVVFVEDVEKFNPKSVRPSIVFLSFNIEDVKTTKRNIAYLDKFYPVAVRIIVVNLQKTEELKKALKMSKAYVFINLPLQSEYVFQAAVVAYEKFTSLVKLSQFKRAAQEKISQNAGVVTKYREKLADVSGKAKELQSRYKENQIQLAKKEKEEKEQLKKIDYLEEKLEIQTKLNEQLTKRNEELEIEVIQLEAFPSQVILALNSFIREFDFFYFTDHYMYVREISMAIAKNMEASAGEIKVIQMVSILHNIYYQRLPLLMRLVNPIELEDELQSVYFKLFNKTMSTLEKIDSLKPYVGICKQIWEHIDGTGFPLGLRDKEVSKVAQIVSIANQYHNMVYRVYPAQMPKFERDGELIQTPALTNNRHKEAVKFFSKNQKWFDYEVIRAFQELAKHKESRFLVPKSDDLRVEYKHIQINLAEESKNLNLIEDIMMKKPVFDYSLGVHKEEKKFEKRLVRLNQIQPGMKTIEAIVTVNGIEVVPKEKEFDSEDLKKINQLHQTNIIGEELELLVPIYE